MKRVLLIGNSSSAGDTEAYFSAYTEFFRNSVAQAAETIEVEYTLFDDLYIVVGDDTFEIYDTRHERQLTEYDALILRGSGFRGYFDVIKSISTFAARHNIACVNDYGGFRDSSKLTQAVQFYDHGLPVAATVYVTEAVLAQKKELPFNFPCILKATFGAHGHDNYLVKSMDEAAAIVQTSSDKKFVLQRYIPNDRDYRILIISDEIAVIERKAAKSSHLNNTSQGAMAQLIPVKNLPPKMIDDARMIIDALHMTIAGVDVLADKETGDFYFLEVNSQPQLMSGAFTELKAEMIGHYLRQVTKAQ